MSARMQEKTPRNRKKPWGQYESRAAAIRDMLDKGVKNEEIAKAVGCHPQYVKQVAAHVLVPHRTEQSLRWLSESVEYLVYVMERVNYLMEAFMELPPDQMIARTQKVREEMLSKKVRKKAPKLADYFDPSSLDTKGSVKRSSDRTPGPTEAKGAGAEQTWLPE